MMNGPSGWLVWANIVIWGGLACYLLFLARTQALLHRRLRRMHRQETVHHE